MNTSLEQKILDRLQRDLEARLVDESIGTVSVNDFQVDDLCESPIERLFLLAVLNRCEVMDRYGSEYGGYHRTTLVAPDQVQNVATEILDGDQHRALIHRWIGRGPSARPHGSATVLVCQAPIGDCRADVLIARMHSDDSGWTFNALVVECDGKDFHDSSVEQLRRDRARDRQFMGDGLKVVRFTGAELYKNFARCVDQLEGIIEASGHDWTPHSYGSANG